MDGSTPGIPVHHQLPELAQTHVHLVSDAIQPSHPLSSPHPPAFSLSQHQGLFQGVSSLHQVAKIWWKYAETSASVFLMTIQDWFPLRLTGWISLQLKGLSRVIQHHSLKASILRPSAFFIVQLSHPYMTTGKTIALTRWTFVGKVTSLLFSMLSRLVIAFLPRSKCLLYFMAAITICSDFGAPQNKVSHCFHCFPIYLPWSDGAGCHDLSFLNVEF